MYANDMSAQKLCVCVCVFANVINGGASPTVRGKNQSACQPLNTFGLLCHLSQAIDVCVCVSSVISSASLSLRSAIWLLCFSFPHVSSLSLLNFLSILNLSAITQVLKNDTTCLPFSYHTVSLYSYFQLWSNYALIPVHHQYVFFFLSYLWTSNFSF